MSSLVTIKLCLVWDQTTVCEMCPAVKKGIGEYRLYDKILKSVFVLVLIYTYFTCSALFCGAVDALAMAVFTNTIPRSANL